MTAVLRSSLLLVGCLLPSLPLPAQQQQPAGVDRAAVPEAAVADVLRDARWVEDEVGVGVTLRTARLPSLFDSRQSLCVLRLAAVVRPRRLRFVAPGPFARVATSKLARDRRALAAVNGGFFDVENGTPLGLLIEDSVLRSDQDQRRDAAVGVDAGGRLHIGPRAAGGWPGMVSARGAWPLLLSGGAVCRPDGFSSKDRRHPRTAIGQTAAGEVVLLTVDGRTEAAAGMTLLELAKVMQALGCRDALNLDGGGSTTMWLRGRGVVNHPSDNHAFDHDGERAVSDALLVFARQILRRDEQHATCTPANGFRRRLDDDAVEGDVRACEVTERALADDAPRAQFAVGVDRGGRYRVELSRRPASRFACEIDGAAVEVGRRGADGWLVLTEGAFAAGEHRVEVRAVAVGDFVVDAVRFVEVTTAGVRGDR